MSKNVWDVVGFQKRQYKSKKTGEDVSGFNVYLRREPYSPDVVGDEVMVLWLSSQYHPYIPKVGDVICIYYNAYGNVDEVELVGDAEH